MIAPKPFKFKCSKCGYRKIIKPKSDALNPMDLISVCPKCKTTMARAELNLLDKILWR